MHTDHRGSLVAESDAPGHRTRRVHLTAYGAPLSESDYQDGPGFAQHVFDEITGSKGSGDFF